MNHGINYIPTSTDAGFQPATVSLLKEVRFIFQGGDACMHAVDVHTPVPELVKLKLFFFVVIFAISTAGGLSRNFKKKQGDILDIRHIPDMSNRWEEDVCNFLCFRNPPQEFRWLSSSSRARDT